MSGTVLLIYSGNWEAGLSASYRRALESYGLRVVQFDLEAARLRVAPLGKIGHRLMRHLDFHSFNTRANRVLVRTATDLKPDLIAVIGPEPVRPASLVQLRISIPGVKIVNIWPDMLFNVRDSMFPCLPLYDRFGCHTRAGLPYLRQAGCTGAYYLPLAADPTLHSPQSLTPAEAREFGSDLVFIGNHRPEHGHLFAALEGMDLSIWGPRSWKDAASPWVRSRWRGREVFTGTEYAKILGAAKICLAPIDPLDLPGHNMRIFEVPACGGFSLVTRTEEVLEFYEEGKSVACFDSTTELVEKVRHYLAHPEERKAIAAEARERAIHGGNTYRDRVRALFEELGLGALLG